MEKESATPTVSAVMLAYNRRQTAEVSLRHLLSTQVDEIIVVDNGSTDGTAAMIRQLAPHIRVIVATRNMADAGWNLGAKAAQGEFLLLVDDDSYPLPGAVETLVAAFKDRPRLGAVGGFIHGKNNHGEPIPAGAVGSFDWALRAGRTGAPPSGGFPATFFPGCGSLVRREAFLDAGGFFEPYFIRLSDKDLSVRMLARGWDIRYLPTAEFEHARPPRGRQGAARVMRYEVRNQAWYFWLRFPGPVAARRIPAYLLLDLLKCASLGLTRSWLEGVAAAWRERHLVRGYRDPIPNELVRRAELHRGRRELAMILWMLWHRAFPRLLRRARSSVLSATDGGPL